MTALIPVTAAPLMDPGQGRIDVEMPEGLSILHMVKQSLPGLSSRDLSLVRVTLVTAKGQAVIDPAVWHCTRPRIGVRVVIRVIPGKDSLRSILMIVVSVAAIALAPYLIPAAGTFGLSSAAWTGLVTAGLTAVGALLVNALVPIKVATADSVAAKYTISGWQNQARPGEPVPLIFGKFRYAPPFAATSYSEIVGDDQYIRALFCFGYGPLNLSAFRIGDNPIEDYTDVVTDIREGRSTDAPITLYPNQVLEDAAGIELVRPLPRDSAGTIIAGAGIETPVTRFTAGDTESASVILAFQSGLFSVDGKGNLQSQTVSIRIRQQPEAGGAWIDVTTLDITAQNRSTFFRQYTWTLPSRGRWLIEVTRMTDEASNTQVSDRTSLAALQSMRPEPPVNMSKPMALVAVRIRATYQLNGPLNNLNALVQRYADAWDGTGWPETLTRNPAAAYIAALKGPANPYPVADSEIDYVGLADWAAWCDTKGLKYDAVHDSSGEKLQDMLSAICGAGRATPHHDGLQWGVVIDRPETLVIDHINPRNSAQFTWSRSYFNPPDAFRIQFMDETNDNLQAERIVPWPGFTGDVTLTEQLDLPGKTDPVEIWIEARRRMYELLYRPDAFTAIQDGAARVATRGDLVMGSFDSLTRTQVAARVKSVMGSLVEMDEWVPITAGTTYAIRFRVYADDTDSIGTSVVREVTAAAGETALLRVLVADQMPTAGAVIHFGEMATESVALRIKGVETGQNFSAVMHMVADAPEIDAFTDAEVPPAWDGRVGAEVAHTGVAPAAPVFDGIKSGLSGTGDTDGLKVFLKPGSGSSAVLFSFQLEHKLATDSIWTIITYPVANGAVSVPGYVHGDAVDLRALAIAVDGTPGPYAGPVEAVLGADDAAVPAALDSDAISVTGELGYAAISLSTGADPATKQIQVYRVSFGGVLNRATDAVGDPFAALPSTTLNYIDGDGTRVNLLGNGTFDTTAVWVTDAHWTITGGGAAHYAGASDTMRQAATLSSGAVYRMAYTVAGRTSGSVTPTLFDGSDQSGVAVSADGQAFDRIVAVAGNDAFGFAATSTFDGTLDDAILFKETANCVPQGAYDYYLEPQNLEGVAGPVSGPFSVNIA